MRISDWSSDVCSSDLRLERRILWLRGAPWIDDRLHGYGDQVVSDTRADWLLRGVGGAVYEAFLERNADARALAGRIAAAEAEAEGRRRDRKSTRLNSSH